MEIPDKILMGNSIENRSTGMRISAAKNNVHARKTFSHINIGNVAIYRFRQSARIYAPNKADSNFGFRRADVGAGSPNKTVEIGFINRIRIDQKKIRNTKIGKLLGYMDPVPPRPTMATRVRCITAYP
jgi:hypothetical protein